MAVQKPGIYHSTLRANCVYGAEYKSEKMSSDTVVDAAIEKVLKRSGTYEMFKDSRTFAQGFDTVKSHMCVICRWVGRGFFELVVCWLMDMFRTQLLRWNFMWWARAQLS